MAQRVQVHSWQLDRIKRDMNDVISDARSLGKTKVLNWVMIVLEFIAVAAYGAWHLWHEIYLIAAQAFVIEIALIIVHAIGMFIEKSMHRTNESRAERLSDEI